MYHHLWSLVAPFYQTSHSYFLQQTSQINRVMTASSVDTFTPTHFIEVEHNTVLGPQPYMVGNI